MGRDGVFHAAAVGFPSCEPRAALPATAARLEFFGAPQLTAEEVAAADMAEIEGREDRLVFLQDVWLDRPETFEALETIFSGAARRRGARSGAGEASAAGPGHAHTGRCARPGAAAADERGGAFTDHNGAVVSSK
jgi:hypothetical protein